MAVTCPEVPLWHLKFEDYLRWLEAERIQGCSVRSLAKYISHLRGLLNYAWRSGRADRNVLDGFRLQDAHPSEPPSVLTLDEAKGLVEACPRTTRSDRRARVMVLLLYGCGLRTEELCSLNVQNVDRERRELFITRGKGDRQRYVPIPDGVFTELLAYLVDRGGQRGALFRTETRARIRSRHVCEVVRDAARRARIDWRVTPKTLRHTFATHLMDRGVDVAVIASLMGHRSPAETGVYLHVLPGKPRAAVDRLNDAHAEGGG
jgi:integrase/recombinase XerD